MARRYCAMTDKQKQAGEQGGAPFETPGKSTLGADATQKAVALQAEINQLVIDIDAIDRGASGSTFAIGERGKLEARIAILQRTLEDLDSGLSGSR